MRTRIVFLLSFTFLTGVPAFAEEPIVEDELRATAQSLFQPIPTAEEVIAARKVSKDQIQLGQWLFFEPRLSSSQIITCNTCHSVGTGGADNIPTSIGHGWQAGPRNSPTVLNAVFNVAQFWDGRADDLAAQAKGPVQASVEMNNTPGKVETALKSIPEYGELFRKAFPGQDEPVTFDNMARALEAFEVTLVTPNSRFDRFLKGESSLDAQEMAGLDLFINKGCVSCHGGQNIGGEGYFPFGVVEKPGGNILPAGDKGRFAVTETATDEYVFRAGPLRNIALTAPYFHSGQVWDLEQAVAIMGVSQLGEELNDTEVKAITAFLRTLTGEQPQVLYPTLPPSTQDTPRPIQPASRPG
ncbi:cytochrome c peroxidase [Pseudochelatococcus lubricantis]|uniref:Cytochrome c peroxidase n=1 Tax=Pseudochelatococcus lubricantis TaxID=1538102 RepID=A0ABX0UYV1_9HYPH|nr:cytochrome-c peroxidase [Pseudochelatococcus lubricantis]NIJ57912.1 cytochrome c peroxidase [Pseudochelatococcus lubricantis]